MEFPPSLLEHLRDEAYAALGREAVQAQLNAVEHEKTRIADTRPPFGGVLASRASRDAFARSMQTAATSESALRERLDRVQRLDEWLQPIIRAEVAAYLAAASTDYQRFQQVRDLLNGWQAAFQAMPELLTAFARDLRNVREQASAVGATGPAQVQALAILREAALRLEVQQTRLDEIARRFQAHAACDAELARDVRLPQLPDFHRVAWVSRLALMSVPQAVEEARRVESEVRAFLAAGNAHVLARLEASATVCTLLEERFLQRYWTQLRTHAQIHYVQERDIDEVLDELAQRYVGADIIRCQRILTRDPFVTER